MGGCAGTRKAQAAARHGRKGSDDTARKIPYVFIKVCGEGCWDRPQDWNVNIIKSTTYIDIPTPSGSTTSFNDLAVATRRPLSFSNQIAIAKTVFGLCRGVSPWAEYVAENTAKPGAVGRECQKRRKSASQAAHFSPSTPRVVSDSVTSLLPSAASGLLNVLCVAQVTDRTKALSRRRPDTPGF